MSREDLKRERKQRVLDAGREALQSAQLQWSKALTFDLLEAATQIDRRQIERDFGSKQVLIDELISHALTYDARESVRASYERMYELASDETLSFREALVEIGRLVHTANLDDPQFTTQLSLAGFAHEHEPTRIALQELYRSWDEGTALLVYRLFESVHKHGVSMRSGLTVKEFVLVAAALSDGLALRAKLDGGLVPEDLVGRAFMALVAAWLTFDGDNRHLGDELATLDDRRQTSPRKT